MSSVTSNPIAMEETPSYPLAFAISIFVLVALFLCYEMATQVSPGVMTEMLRQDLNLSAAQLGWMSGYYFIPYTLMQFPAGLLFDRFRVRSVIIFPLLVCVLGAYVFGQAQSLIDAAIARILMGFGGAYAFIAVLVVADDVFPKKHFAMLAGFAQFLAALGALAGVAPLLPLIHSIGWRMTMVSMAGVGLLLAGFIWLFVRYEKKVKQEVQTSIWMSLGTICRHPQTWIIAVYACCLWAPMAAFASLWGKQFLVEHHQLSAMNAAWLVSIMWLGVGIGSPILGWWSDHIGQRKLPLILSAAFGAVSFLLLILLNHLPLMTLAALLFVAGAACSGQVLSFAVAKENHADNNHAAAIGFNNMAVVIAGLIFQPLIGELIEWHNAGVVKAGHQAYQASDYDFAMMIIPLVYGLGLLVATFFIKETHCRSRIS